VIELKILTGKQAGAIAVARRFPFQLGRQAGAGLSLDDPGLFERHAEIQLGPRYRLFLQAHPSAITSVNGEVVERSELRNGDIIQCGSVQVQFGLSAPRQRGFVLREALTWMAIGGLGFAQVGLIYWLLE
jgi:pSer/pThr/pTyr-binding forkhead associated (FHA) protein